MKKLLPYFFALFLSVPGYGQSTNISTFFLPTKTKADALYSQKAYRNALEIYLRIAEKNGGDTYCKKQIAECYRFLNDPLHAEFWYASAVTDSTILPEVKIHYAQMLCMNKKYPEALKILNELANTKTDTKLVKEQIKFIENISYYLRDSSLFTVAPANAINSVHSDFSATYYRRGHVVFASTRDHDLFIKHKSLSSATAQESPTNLYIAPLSIAGDFGGVDLFKKDQLKSIFHDGPIEFYKNFKKAAFTRSNFSKRDGIKDATGSVNLKLYLADVGALGGLNNITPFPFNSDGYSVGHATFTADGNRMYFASTMPLGLGGSDIYVSNFVNGEWTDPVNAGSAINSSGDELYPHLENDSTLTFASTGHGGFGGLDIFISKIKRGQFKPARNLGYPANTEYDDFSLVTDSSGRVGFFASNRPGGKGSDDIYRFVATKIFLQGQTRDLGDLSIVPNTKVIIQDEFKNILDSTTSDSQGNFYLDIPFDTDMIITAKKEGYDMLEDIGFSSKGLSFGVDSLLLPLWKHGLFAKGRIFSNETQSILPGATVIRKDLNTGEADTVVVGENGEYHFLVKPNQRYRIEAMKEEFITNGFELNTKELYKGDLLNDIVLEEVYIEKAVPLFDLNKSNIRTEAFKMLDKIVRTLKKFPSATLNIGAHADSRGSKEYNKRLSGKRAATVVQYFTDRGIARSRIESQAFGEELILNQCSDGVVCSEEDHSHNRRVEIKVQHRRID